jgi:CheY-like chemotaxis protein
MKKKLTSILLIDDDEPTNFMYKIIIGNANCTEKIIVAQSGEEALNHLAHSIPDLIFLDINMPRMDGWEFIEKFTVLQKPADKIPVIIMLSTTLNPDDELRANNTPAISGFMRKPLTAKTLGEVLANYFDDNNDG